MGIIVPSVIDPLIDLIIEIQAYHTFGSLRYSIIFISHKIKQWIINKILSTIYYFISFNIKIHKFFIHRMKMFLKNIKVDQLFSLVVKVFFDFTSHFCRTFISSNSIQDSALQILLFQYVFFFHGYFHTYTVLKQNFMIF